VTDQWFTVALTNVGQINVWGQNDDVWFTGGPNLIDGLWHTVTVTYNGAGLLSLYIDNAFIQSQTTFSYPGGPIVFNTVGDNNWLDSISSGFNPYPYIGYLKNITFYDYALTALEAGVTVAPSTVPSMNSSTIFPSSRLSMNRSAIAATMDIVSE